MDLPLVPRLLTGIAVIVFALAACGGSMTLTEYATAVESSLNSMNAQLAEDVAAVEAVAPSIAVLRDWADNRMALRHDFLAGLEELNPPSEAADLHEAALAAVRALVAAEQELADQAHATDDVEMLLGLWDTPAGEAAQLADQKAVEICLAAQAALDATADRSGFVGMPWVPLELQQVVRVAFACTGDEQ